MFNILLNGKTAAPNVSVYARAQNALYKPIQVSMLTSTLLSGRRLAVSFEATNTSTIGPLVNALEMLSITTKDAFTEVSDGTRTLISPHWKRSLN